MQDPGYPSDAGTSASGIKRSRTQTRNACTRCRQRRVKCSGDVPCQRCQEIGENDTCIVPTRTARATSSRIAELEHRVQVLTAKLDAARGETATTAYGISSSALLPKERKGERALFLSESGVSSARPAKRQFVSDAWSDEDNSDDKEGPSAEKERAEPLLGKQRLPDITLLGPAKTRRILQLYADQTQPIHPVLAWSKFLEDYEANEPLLPYVPDRIWLATLQVVIAHALQTISPEIEVLTSPTTLFIESLQVLGLPVLLATTSPALVQCLLLLTAFAQTLNEPDLGMSLLGLAIQKCKSLGFTSQAFPDGNGRLARLCWSGCISRDFYISVALGKTPFMNEQDCRIDLLPLSQEEDALLRDPHAQPHPLAFWNEGIKLHHIVISALHNLYPHVGSERFNGALLQDLDERLLLWHRQLPAFLQPDKQPIASREASYIQSRFWYSRNLVHRSALCHLLSPRRMAPAQGMASEMLNISAKLAIEAGLQLIDRLCPIMSETTTAWWINLIGLYSACLTLLMGAKLDSKCPSSPKISPERSSVALQTAIDAFHRFSIMTGTRLMAASKTSEYCVADIKRLRQKVPALSVPDASATGSFNVAPMVPTEPWYFAGYDWSSLFDVSGRGSHGDSNVLTGLESTQFDFSQMLDQPGLPTYEQGQETLLSWLQPSQ